MLLPDKLFIVMIDRVGFGEIIIFCSSSVTDRLQSEIKPSTLKAETNSQISLSELISILPL